MTFAQLSTEKYVFTCLRNLSIEEYVSTEEYVFFRIIWEVFYDFTFTFLRQKNDFGYMAARHIGPIDRMRLNYWGTFNSNWFERTLWVAIKETSIFIGGDHYLNPLRANSPKWSNTLKQFVSKLSTNCLSVFDHFVGLLPA